MIAFVLEIVFIFRFIFFSRLLQAHYHSRKADNHLRCRRFDDAIESHKKAANALDDALTATAANSKASESIRLQRDFHMKRIDLIRLKKKQYESYKTAIEYQRLKTIEPQISKARLESTCDLQIAIYKTLEEANGLLETLGGQQKSNDELTHIPDDSHAQSNDGRTNTTDTKNDGTKFNDLHALNHQLHILVFNLMSKMDETNNEIESLRDRVKMLEKERGGPLRSPVNAKLAATAANNVEQRSGESSRRGSITGEERKIILPESSDFPPLELPEFDYNSYDKENETQ